MKAIMFDAEVFPKSAMFGFLIVHENGTQEIFQSWDKEEIKQFYLKNKDNSIFVGHNSTTYDVPILEEIVKGRNPYLLSQRIVKDNFRAKSYLDITTYDIMRVRRTPFSLKITELISGRNIHTTDVDFNLDRELNEEEKRLTEEYNKDDLKQTLYNFQKFYPQFKLRLDIGLTFNIPVKEALELTEAQLAAKVLGAKKDPSLKYKPIQPILWDNLRLKNQKVINFYLNEEYQHKNLNIVVCGTEHTLGKGGIHAALNKVYYDKVIYLDVGGYYNSIMIQLDLFPRTMNQESKQRYIDMFHQQLEMKKDPTKKNARKAYKTILLAVFGAMNNEYGDFYDPYKFILVTLSGQLFLVDLLEKLEGLVDLVQSNTDGICLYPHNWDDESKIDEIVKEWEKRTGFNMEKEYLYHLWQRDVNCYFAVEESGNIHYKGNSLINYKVDDESYGACRLFDATEPPIMAKGIIDYLLYDIDPEETVEKNKKDLRLFQYPCKKGTFDYMTEDKYVFTTNAKGKQISQLYHSRQVKPLNRVFAKKVETINGLKTYTVLTKHKDNHGKHQKTKVPNLPDSVFIYNEDITDAYDIIKDQIDWQYYINRIYEKLGEFVQIDEEPKKSSKENIDIQQLSFDL
jgi:hypothetical protein